MKTNEKTTKINKTEANLEDLAVREQPIQTLDISKRKASLCICLQR